MKMRTNHSFTVLLCSFIMIFLFSCGTNGGGTSSSPNTNSQNSLVGENSLNIHKADPQNPLIGTWVSGGYSLSFKSDNTYLRDFNHEGIPAVRGSVAVSGNVLIVTDSSSCISSTTEKNTIGSYTYAISGNTLIFSLFHDPCSDRAAFFGLTYTKQ